MTQSMNMYHDLLLYSTDDSVWSIFNILNDTPGPAQTTSQPVGSWPETLQQY